LLILEVGIGAYSPDSMVYD